MVRGVRRRSKVRGRVRSFHGRRRRRDRGGIVRDGAERLRRCDQYAMVGKALCKHRRLTSRWRFTENRPVSCVIVCRRGADMAPSAVARCLQIVRGCSFVQSGGRQVGCSPSRACRTNKQTSQEELACFSRFRKGQPSEPRCQPRASISTHALRSASTFSVLSSLSLLVVVAYIPSESSASGSLRSLTSIAIPQARWSART